MVEKRPLGNPKPESKFGSTNKGSFGKIPSKGSFGKKSKPIITRGKVPLDDLKYLVWLKTQTHYTCFICNMINTSDPIEWHHVKLNSSSKKNHKQLIPLCGHEHHRNGQNSPHGNPNKWREEHSMRDQEALADAIYQEYKDAR